MSDFDRNYAARRGFGAARAAAIDAGLRAYMLRVYNYMAVGVALTGVVAWLTYQAAGGDRSAAGGITGADAVRAGDLRRPADDRAVPRHARHGVLPELPHQPLQPAPRSALFMLYAGLLGLMLSSMFLAYTGASITRTFFISAASFGALSLYGYTTQRDLSPIGSFLIMGLFGLILAMLVNIFLRVSGLEFAISAIGVLIFAGLTAWDTQKIKEMYRRQ